jgi:hypothetical protein
MMGNGEGDTSKGLGVANIPNGIAGGTASAADVVLRPEVRMGFDLLHNVDV